MSTGGSGPARRSRSERGERRSLRAAAIAAVLLVLGTVIVFTKSDPFASHFQIKGVFSSANQLKNGSPVRIAGVDIGEVRNIGPGPGNSSTVTLQIDDRRIPIHTDARLAIEPRLILEGNDYVRVDPGTPTSPVLPAGATVPLARTQIAVQLDQVLDIFTQPIRQALNSAIDAFGSGLGSAHGAPVSVTGAVGLREAVRQLDGALPSVTQVAAAAQGTEPGDLPSALAWSGAVTGQLAANPPALAGLVTHYSELSGTLAASDSNLAATLQGIDQVLRTAPPSLTAIDATLPALTRFAWALRPGLTLAPPALDQVDALLGQIGAISQPRELPAFLAALRPVTSALPTLEQQLGPVLPLVTHASTCVSQQVIPTLDERIQDGPNTTGDPVWQDLLHMGGALAGASPNFDGDGTTIRLGVAEGETALLGALPGIGTVAGGANVEGVNPTWLGYGISSPYRPDQWCDQQKLPLLNSRYGLAPSGFHSVSRPASTPVSGLQSLVSALTLKLQPKPSTVSSRPSPSPSRPAAPQPAAAPGAASSSSPTSVASVTAPVTKVVGGLLNALLGNQTPPSTVSSPSPSSPVTHLLKTLLGGGSGH
jgi:phospholipid/cholesterol/gamma-HCH transport system substrate-binding protein